MLTHFALIAPRPAQAERATHHPLFLHVALLPMVFPSSQTAHRPESDEETECVSR